MPYSILNGREPARILLERLQETIRSNHLKPCLGIVVVGEYTPSQVYVERKRKTAEEVGIETEIHRLPHNVEEADVLALIDRLNADPRVHGFIVQTPLPPHIHANRVLERIAPAKDVDGFHPSNMGRVLLNMEPEFHFAPATPAGIMVLLDHYRVPIAGKHAVVVGRSNIVGKPVAILLLHANATVTICHTRTVDLASYTRQADILIAAAGSPGLIRADMVKEGAYIVDVGTTRTQVDGKDKVVGDVDFEQVTKKAHCSPVPGGVGPLTVAMLLSNTVKAAMMMKKR